MIEPDASGATTIREQRLLHCQNPACTTCHQKIDPFGFGLDNFDAIGRWRDTYASAGKIDPSGKLPKGEEFVDTAGFRELIIDRHEEFTLALTEKLLTYALVRRLQFTDQAMADKISSTLLMKHGGLKELVRAIVLSEPFGTN